MLKHLHIHNYALIQELNLDFNTGFSVITGETGAGKSILLGAIGLLLGQRADTKSIQQGAHKCVIEAVFDVSNYNLQLFFEENELDFDGHECIIRRELADTGKSRAFINDSPASIAQLRQLGEHLIDIHSQHQNLLLGQEDFQMNVLDLISSNRLEKNAYKESFDQWKQVSQELEQLKKEAEQNRTDEEFLTFQLQQLEELKPQVGEDEELQNEAEILSHAEEIKTNLFQAENLLSSDDSGIVTSLRQTRQLLQSIAHVYPNAEELVNRMDSAYIELKDIQNELYDQAEGIEFNPQRLEQINNRLDQLYNLEHKHHVESSDELIEIADKLRERLDGIANYEDRINHLNEQITKFRKEVDKKAAILTDLRTKAAQKLINEMQQRLIPLGIPNARFHVEITPLPHPCTTGVDHVTFLFSANKNGTLNPISQVASGGEIARIMLTLKALISDKAQLPTIIFDEIDTGVSGRIAECMAQTMREMSQGERQVISITHLPQIAALGQHHYFVYKHDTDEQTLSHIRPLDENERIHEIAHMLSGADITQAAIENAKQLLKL